MSMMDLCDPSGDSAYGTEDIRNTFPEPKSYFLRFSDKPANGFLLNNLTSLLMLWPTGYFLYN